MRSIPSKTAHLLLLSALAVGVAFHVFAQQSGELPTDAQTSELWGASGELWDPAGRLPDYSFAGYRYGAAIPSPGVVANVMDFGAVGNGVADDTTAFQDAIAAAGNSPSGGAVLIPAGRYMITKILYLKKSNVVLRGAGEGLTTLFFPKHLREITGAGGSGSASDWTYSGGLIWVEGTPGGTNIATIDANADRGDRVIQVSTTSGLAVGNEIRITMTESDGSLEQHIYAEGGNGTAPVRMSSRISAISGNQVTLDQPLRLNVRTQWSPVVRKLSNFVREVGVEDLTIEFPNRPYRGHFEEDGYNGIFITGSRDCWVRRVRIHNSEGGIYMQTCAYVTADQVTLSSDEGTRWYPWQAGLPNFWYTGHHGIQCRNAEDNLISNFQFLSGSHYLHYLSVEGAVGCVFTKGSAGYAMNFDHHGGGSHQNLFTEINVSGRSRMYDSSGAATTAAYETFWNISGSASSSADSLPTYWARVNLIAVTGSTVASQNLLKNWVEPIPNASLIPANLYDAQLARRLSPPPLVERTLTWDGSGVGTSGAQGGAGNWAAASSMNWWNGSANEPWPARGGSGDHATFGGSAGTVTIAPEGVVANSLEIGTSGYVFTGGPVFLNGASPSISLTGAGTCRIDSVLGGSSGLVKSGAGTLELGGVSRYQGDTRVHQGGLKLVSGNHRLPATSRLILGDGANSGVLQMNSRSQLVGGLLTSGSGVDNRVINGSPTICTFTASVPNGAETNLFNGTLGGGTANDNNYHFGKDGSGTLVLPKDNTYTGNTTIAAGVLQIGNGGTSGSIGAGVVTNNGILRFDRSGTVILSQNISGTGGLEFNKGNFLLRGTNSFNGNVVLSSGTLNIGSSFSLGAGTKSVNLNSDTAFLQLEGTGIIIPASITINAQGGIASGWLQNVSGNNTIAGPIHLVGSGGSSLISSDGGALTLAGNITATAASVSLKLDGTSTSVNQIAGAITDTGSKVMSVEKNGPGIWSLSGANTYSGSTLVRAGTLRIQNDSALGDTAVGTTLSTGAKLQIEGVNLNIAEPLTLGESSAGVTVENLSGNNTLSGNITRTGALVFLSTAGDLNVQGPINSSNNSLYLQGAGNGTISGTITKAFLLNKTGAGEWEISGVQPYTGPTQVSGGTLTLSGSLSSNIAVSSSGSISARGAAATSGSLTLGSTASFKFRPGGTLSVSGAIQLSGSLILDVPRGLLLGTSYTILENSGTGPISGGFAGLAEGAVFSQAGYDWSISYAGGPQGKSIVLTITNGPANAMESWRHVQFGFWTNTGIAADTADPDDDGLTNAQEFAAGSDPNVSNIPSISILSPAAEPVTLATTSHSLRFLANASVSGTSLPPTVAWSKELGPGTILFTSSSTDTLASFSAPGTYQVKCTVTSGSLAASALRTVIVEPPAALTLQQGQNGYVQAATFIRNDGSNATMNSGARDQLLVGYSNTGAFRTLLSFGLSSRPSGFTPYSVRLDLWTSNATGAGSISDLKLHALTGTPTEGSGNSATDPTVGATTGATWVRRTDATQNLNWTTSGGDYSPTVLASVPGYAANSAAIQTLKSFGPTAELNAALTTAIQTSSPLNLMLLTDTASGSNFTRLHSDDSPDTARRPMLTLGFTKNPAPVIDPGTAPAAIINQPAPLAATTSGTASLWSIVSGPGTATFSDATAPVSEVTFSTPGSYLLRLSASNADGESARSLAVSVGQQTSALPISAFVTWQKLNWPGVSDPQIIAPVSDPDQDGIANLLEYILAGGDPHAPSTGILPHTSSSGDSLIFSYIRCVEASKGTVQIVQFGNLDGAWTDIPVTSSGAVAITPVDGSPELELVTVVIPVTDSNRMFARLKVTDGSN